MTTKSRAEVCALVCAFGALLVACGSGSDGSAAGAGTAGSGATGARAGAGGAGAELSACTAGLVPGPLVYPKDFLTSVRDFGAVGDGLTDDTAAIRKAIESASKLYFPAGTYVVSDSLQWNHCCVTIRGQGSGVTTIRLANGSAGFADPKSPRAVFRTGEGNMSFGQYFFDLTVDTGSDNPGAIGIDWISNNDGALRNVAVRSGDGKGVAGIEMTRGWPGPCLAKHVRVEGFDYGIRVAGSEYGPTFEDLALVGQRVAGFDNRDNRVALRRLCSRSSAPAIVSHGGSSMFTLIDAVLDGGAAEQTAIVQSDGAFYARGVTSSGYGKVLSENGVELAAAKLDEHLTGQARSLFAAGSPAHSLGLPIAETPEFHEMESARWVKWDAPYYVPGDGGGLVEALATPGKSTVYIPNGLVQTNQEVRIVVPAGIRHIRANRLTVNPPDAGAAARAGIWLVIDQDSEQPLIVEGLLGVHVEHTAKRSVVFLDSGVDYQSKPGCGDVYFEDVMNASLRIQPGQQVWARQLNNEGPGPKVVNDGGVLWILGLKTEGAGTIIETRQAGQTELLGTLIYPATAVPSGAPAFLSVDARMSLIYGTSAYVAGGDYAVQVRETRKGVTRELNADAVRGQMALYTGY